MDSTNQQPDSRPVNPKHADATNQSDPLTMDEEGTPFIGYLNVLIHQARDIQNICIYHKQDVYAKVSLTGITGANSDNTDSVSTRTINGGGRNPVFNESLRLGVRALESTVRCEIWMLSRVKNYLQDQLLGLTQIPLSDLLVAPDNKLTGEFALSSNDLFESPSGFVQLALSYSGSSPEVIPIPSPVSSKKKVVETKEANGSGGSASELEKIQFPDLELVKENRIMVSEYFGIPCAEIENAPVPSSGSLTTTEEDSENPNSHEAGVRVVESFSTTTPENSVDSVHGEPLSSVSTYTNSEEKEEDKTSSEVTETEAESSEVKPSSFNFQIEQEHNTVNQKEIVDMYMKSMQQFTESLAKMKLPNMDLEHGSPSLSPSPNSNSSENGSSISGKRDGNSKDKNSRVFYGSRAFF